MLRGQPMILQQFGAYTDQFGIGPGRFFTMLNVHCPYREISC